MNEEKNQKILAVVLVIAVIALGVYKLFFNKDKSNGVDTKTISVVNDINEFYTVSNCVDKLFMYINIEDKENILVLLSKEYKKENGVDSINIFSFISKFDKDYSFMPKKMFVQRKSKNVYKYYVYGKKVFDTGEDLGDGYLIGDNYYIVVLLDKSNMTFAVEPYDGAIFNK